jgi:CRISPR-associated protein Csn2
MMQINFPLFDESIEVKGSTTLVIEDTQVFSNFIKLTYQYSGEDGLKIFNEKQNRLKPTELVIITDILGFDINSSSTLKLIYADLEEQLNVKPEVKSMIQKLTATISELIGYELLEHELDLEEDEITIQELFKALGVKIETSSDTIYEKMLEIIQIFKYLSKKRLLVFVNTCSYLTKEELLELHKYISLNNTQVLFVEPRKIVGIEQYILDKDYYIGLEKLL